MKIRIKGNTLRIRITKAEMDLFAEKEHLEEQTEFGNNNLTYTLRQNESDKISAAFDNNRITVFMPKQLAAEWINSNRVGFEERMPVGNGRNLYLLLEKDFKCLDQTIEDQSDNYENPLVKH
jgi:hypothetical protein